MSRCNVFGHNLSKKKKKKCVWCVSHVNTIAIRFKRSLVSLELRHSTGAECSCLIGGLVLNYSAALTFILSSAYLIVSIVTVGIRQIHVIQDFTRIDQKHV